MFNNKLFRMNYKSENPACCKQAGLQLQGSACLVHVEAKPWLRQKLTKAQWRKAPWRGTHKSEAPLSAGR